MVEASWFPSLACQSRKSRRQRLRRKTNAPFVFTESQAFGSQAKRYHKGMPLLWRDCFPKSESSRRRGCRQARGLGCQTASEEAGRGRLARCGLLLSQCPVNGQPETRWLLAGKKQLGGVGVRESTDNLPRSGAEVRPLHIPELLRLAATPPIRHVPVHTTDPKASPDRRRWSAPPAAQASGATSQTVLSQAAGPAGSRDCSSGIVVSSDHRPGSVAEGLRLCDLTVIMARQVSWSK
jgi:hypothetical protein